MAVAIKQSGSLEQFEKMLGLKFVDACKAHGVTPSLMLSSVIFRDDKTGQKVADVALGQLVSNFLKGSVDPTSQAMVVQKISGVLNSITKPSTSEVNSSLAEVLGKLEKHFSIDFESKNKNQAEPEPKAQVKVAMYSTVPGTSKGSKYYVVAVAGDVVVAVKLGSGSISIRVVGTEFSPGEQIKLQEFGLTKKEEYWSVHLSVHKTTPAKVLGAFLTHLGLTWETPVPNLKNVGVLS